MSNELFDSPPCLKPEGPRRIDDPRVREPIRNQVTLLPTCLDDLIEEGHPARAIWAVTGKLDLRAYYDQIKARESGVGRSAIDPRLLIALWLYATSDGVGSARRLAKLIDRDAPYRWLCGGIRVNHHTLSDFRVNHEAKLDKLFTSLLAVLMDQKLVPLRRVAHDGTKVRANAGTRSFRRGKTLKDCLEAAKKQVLEVKEAGRKEDSSSSAKQQAAQQRHAEEYLLRVERALEKIPLVEEQRRKKNRDVEFARASTTDIDANIMKMPDGGFRPAYNCQISTDVDSRVIVGVAVTSERTDQNQMKPALDDIERRLGKCPEEMLFDAGYTNLNDISNVAGRGVKVFAPLKQQKKTDGREPKPRDPPGVAEWRARMGDEETKLTYRLRAATAETTNADLKTKRSLDRLVVRGISKVRCAVIWSAMAYNVMKLITQA